MATTYTALKSEIAAFTHRSDLTAYLDTFIQFAEARLNRDLRVSQQETILTETATQFITLPADFLAVRVLSKLSNPVQELKYITPAEMDRIADGSSTLNYYTILGDSIKLQAASSTDVELTYYAKVPALSGTVSTNWVLDTHPDVYLYACLLEAYNWTQNEAQANKYATLYMSGIDTIRRADNIRKYGNSLTVRAA